MSTKPENTFIGSVHKKFGGKKPYIEKMYNPLRSGTPDVYYSGDVGDLGSSTSSFREYREAQRSFRTSRLDNVVG